MNRQGYSTSEVSREARVSLRQLYYWELVGLVSPEHQSFGSRRFRRYRQPDLDRLLEIKAWLDMGYSLEAVRKKITDVEAAKHELL